MARVYATPTRDAIVDSIKANGPLSAFQLADLLSMNRRTVNSAIRHARLPGKPKVLYIKDYDRHFGLQGKSSPLYDIGDLPDAPVPVPDAKAAKRRYLEKLGATERRNYCNTRRRKIKDARQRVDF